MNKCKFCNKRYSEKVLNIHIKRCLEDPKNIVEEAKKEEVKKEIVEEVEEIVGEVEEKKQYVKPEILAEEKIKIVEGPKKTNKSKPKKSKKKVK